MEKRDVMILLAPLLAARNRRLQSLGLKWYNGVDNWPHRSGWEAMAALVWPSAVGR